MITDALMSTAGLTLIDVFYVCTLQLVIADERMLRIPRVLSRVGLIAYPLYRFHAAIFDMSLHAFGITRCRCNARAPATDGSALRSPLACPRIERARRRYEAVATFDFYWSDERSK